jgi:protein TonB
MSKLSIYENAWLNLVFEGKNKEYGAYQLRQESPRTTLYAFLLGVLFVASISGIGLLLSSFGSKPPMNPTRVYDDSLHVTVVDLPKHPEPVLPESHPATRPTEAPLEELLHDPIIVSTPNATDPVFVNAAVDPNHGTNIETSGTGTTETSGTGTTTVTASTPPDNGTAIATTVTVDVMPEFPGGIKKFLEYVGNNFEKPEIDETVTILMSFVIEKDGSMTDIKVLRNPGYGLDKEAIRVLKSQRTKWKAGIKNGQPIRVLYTLPIKVTRS